MTVFCPRNDLNVLLASALGEKTFDVLLLPQEFILRQKPLAIILTKELNGVRFAAALVASLTCSDEIVFPVRAALRNWQKMVKDDPDLSSIPPDAGVKPADALKPT